MVEVKQIDLPVNMQRVSRDKRRRKGSGAKVINAEGEYQASARLAEAALILAKEPTALQLRFLQTLVEVSAEKNSSVIFPIPIDLLEHFFGRIGGRKGIDKC
jgi:regulator of protease activity HflC (stomatin/prohibitin superfamily)